MVQLRGNFSATRVNIQVFYTLLWTLHRSRVFGGGFVCSTGDEESLFKVSLVMETPLRIVLTSTADYHDAVLTVSLVTKILLKYLIAFT